MALPISFNPNQPIPNSPFYSPETHIIQGAYSPLIVGVGISVDQNGVISATGGGGGVNTLIAGVGIGLSGPTGNVTISNTGVTSIIPGVGISASSGTGAVTLSVTAAGTVTSVSTGTGLTGGPITTSGTISLSSTGVTPGTYTNPSIIVDAEGRITGASNGTAIGAVVGTSPINVSTVAGTSTVSIDAASITAAGAVQLSDSVTDTSIALAATANAVKTAFDAAAAAIPKACLTAKGDLISATGASIPAPLPVGADGEVLTADSTCATGLKWAAGGGGSVSGATPTVAGIVLGCTTSNIAALGCNALVANAGSYNTAVGMNALTANTGGSYNTAIGSFSLSSNLSGADNVAVGMVALLSNTSGSYNNAFGNSSLFSNTTGSYNTAVGTGSMFLNSSGSFNTAVGPAAMRSNDTGSYNVAVGYNAALNNLTGCYNTAVGNGALNTNTSGCFNNAFGQGALGANSIGVCNNAYGFGALGVNDTGNNNTAVGAYAMQCNCTGSFNTGVGDCSLYRVNTGSNNVGIGCQAGSNITSGSNNVAIGPFVKVASASGNCQLAIGFSDTDNWLIGNSTKAIQPGAGIIDCANTCGTANQVLVSTGANSVQWKSVNSAIAAPNYGNFYSTAIQTPLATSTGQPVTLNGIAGNNNFTIASGSQITALAEGVYNLQFSIQLVSTSGGGGAVEIWLARNGFPVADSNTRFSVKNVNETEFAALNYVTDMIVGEYLELYWATDNLSIQLLATTSTMGGPDIPSVIVTIVPVGA